MTISLSFRELPLASYRCQARMGLIPTNFTVRSECFGLSITSIICFLPYRYFNEFLVLYSGFPDSRQTDLMSFPYIVRGLSHRSHQRIIPEHRASIFHQPQGFCFWLLYDDTPHRIVDSFYLLI